MIIITPFFMLQCICWSNEILVLHDLLTSN